jgi:hypothetical protein
MVVAGPSKSGKMKFVKQLVQNTHWISPSLEKIVWCYREWQKPTNPLGGGKDEICHSITVCSLM